MAHEIVAGQFGDFRAYSTAAGGTALSTTPVFISLPKSAYHILVTPRNFATAVVAQIAFSPTLVVLKTTDNMATAPTDYTSAVQDADSSTTAVFSSLGALTAYDFFLIGSYVPFRGVYVTVSTTNSLGTATMAVHYNKSGTWTDTTATDGTNSTMTLAQSGLVYWTVPTDWTPAMLKDLYPTVPAFAYSTLNYYWTRWSVSAALTDTTVTVSEMLAANRLDGTTLKYGELLSGQSIEERITTGIGGISGIEAKTNAGTANLVVNVATVRGGKF